MENEDYRLAGIAYETYRKTRKKKMPWNGELTYWNELPALEKECWVESVKAVEKIEVKED